MRRLALLAILACASSLAQAKIVTRDVEYTVDKQALHGVLAYDDAVKEQRPGVLVMSEGAAVSDAGVHRALEVARMGYVAFAATMQGEVPKEGLALALRAKPALDVVRRQPQTDPERLAAVGFGYGGTAVLHLAYAGAHLRAAASFDGALMPPDADERRRIRCAILLVDLEGAAEREPQALVAMRQALAPVHVDFEIATYGRAQPGRGERRAWATMRAFLSETLR